MVAMLYVLLLNFSNKFCIHLDYILIDGDQWTISETANNLQHHTDEGKTANNTEMHKAWCTGKELCNVLQLQCLTNRPKRIDICFTVT